MTNKQCEHLGRAMMAAAELAYRVESLRDIRNSLIGELSLLIGTNGANKIDSIIMTDHFPTYRLGDILTDIATTVKEEKK